PPAAAGELAPESLLDWLEQAQVSLMHTVPSLFRTLLAAEPTGERLPALKHLLLAGEPLYGTDVKRWRSVFGDRIELTNLYGATETTLVKCYHRVVAADAGQERVPVGRPMPGCKAIILDADGRIRPRGQIGELHLRTPYATHGYYRQPEKTAAVFIVNPLCPDSGERIYKTGDLARQRPDGLFEILGRKDAQLKIRGVRVEPGEVENQLLDYPGVEQAAVLGVAGPDGDVELHAHLEAAGDLDIDAIRLLLSERLPPAFVPNRFHVHAQLPLTATGKIDRKALLNQVGPVRADYEPPEGEIEQALAQIWCEVLKVERVGRNDDFFAIGGHSLKVLQVIAKTRKVFEVDVYPRSLFESSTLAGFAARLLESKQQSFEPIEPVEEQPRYPASFAQFRLWLQHELRPQTAAHNVFLVIELAAHWDMPMLRWVLNRLVERHESLRTVFEHDEDKLFQKIWPSLEIDLPERRVDSEVELAELIKAQAGKRFDLGGPLLRTQVLHTWDDRRLLLWCTHEIIGDGSSLAILQREIERLMQAYRAGVELPLPRIHYKDFAVWQRRKLVVENSPARAYWHRQLQGPITWLDLPFDYPLTGESDWGSQVYEFRLPGELNAGLNRLAQSQQTTLFMLLQSALSTLLMRLTGRQDIILAVPVAGREHPDVQSIVGFFVSTILLRHNVDPEQRFIDLLEQVKQTTMDGLEHQQYPFDRLVDELDLPRGANRFPVTPVIFNMLSFFEKGLKSEIGNEKYTIPAAVYHRGHRSIERHARVELEIYAYEDEEGVGFQCHYRSSLFKPETIEYLLDEFQRLLYAVVRSPEAPLNSYEVLKGIEASRATWAKQVEEQALVAYRPPEGETEEHLARIWSEVLGIEQVGRDDNFFAIGGHSIKALLAISRIRKELNVVVRPRLLFESPTLADFAAQLFKVERRQFEPIEPVDEQPRYPASSQQFRLWLQQQLRPQSVAHNGARAVELEAHWDNEMLHWVLNRLVERHESLRTIFEFDDNQLFQKILPPFEVSLPESHVGSEVELNEKIKAHMGAVFDLSVSPQFRLALIHTWDGRRILLWCIHEINSDGSSLVILQREMHRLIRAYREGTEPPAPRIQYKDFAVWQRKQTADKDNPARVYWHRQLQGPIERLELPFDYPLTMQSDWLSRIFEIRIPAGLEAGLERLAQSQQATLFMVLQSALSALLMRLTGQQDIILAAPVTGREHPDVQSIMGVFVNPVLFRHRVEAEQTFTDLLGRVKQTTIDGLMHQSYPFDRLVDELDLPRDTNAFPVTPIVFNMLSFLEAGLMEGIGAEKYISPTGDDRVHRSVERHARCELELYAVKDSDGLCLQCHYRSALFKPETIEYLMDEFKRLLEAVIHSPEARLDSYPVLAGMDSPEVWRARRD
ncbi:MAG TPA: condensation domain-containing protein, partial [Gammaproteobacteria bacterium]